MNPLIASTFDFGSLENAADPVIDFLPRLLGAIAVLVIGLFLARLVAKLITKVLLAAKVDQFGERVGLGESLAQVGLGRSVTRLISGVVRIFLSIFVVVVAVGLLGVQSLEEPINEFILFLPRLLVAIAIVFVGAAAAGYVSDWVNRLTSQMGIEGPLGTLAGAVVIALFVIVAASQAGIPTSLFIVLVAILLGAAALTVALAFGFGGRSVAQQLTAGRYLGDDLSIGQSIQVGDAEGRIIRFEASYLLLEADSGQLVRVPNSDVLNSIVRVSPLDD